MRGHWKTDTYYPLFPNRSKVIPFCDRICNVIALLIATSGHRNESTLLKEALPQVTRIVKKIGLGLSETVVSLDGVYDCLSNRKAIVNCGMILNISVNPRGRKTPKRGCKPIFNPSLLQKYLLAIKRVFAWENKFKRLLIRFERTNRVVGL